MYRRLLLPLVPVFLYFLCQSLDSRVSFLEWGFYGHRLINRTAVFCLPQEMLMFYKTNIDFIEQSAVNADKRRYAVSSEAPRHFIDLDRYGSAPFTVLPRSLGAALFQYTDLRLVTESGDTIEIKDRLDWDTSSVTSALLKAFYAEEMIIEIDSALADAININTDSFSSFVVIDTFTMHGILPYHLISMQRRLTKAIEQQDHARILALSADIGHYIADAHVPLHTTSNYDGQLTGQAGLHAFWESRIPELLADNYDFWVGQAKYIEDKERFFWEIVMDSHFLVDSVLIKAKHAKESMQTDKQFGFERRGRNMINTQSAAYVRHYSDVLEGMVEDRMRAAVHAVASSWYTAWVDAEQPDLGPELDFANQEIHEDTVRSASQVTSGRGHE